MKNIKDMSKIYLNESHIRAIIKETLENLILGEDDVENNGNTLHSFEDYMNVLNNTKFNNYNWEINNDESYFNRNGGYLEIYTSGEDFDYIILKVYFDMEVEYIPYNKGDYWTPPYGDFHECNYFKITRVDYDMNEEYKGSLKQTPNGLEDFIYEYVMERINENYDEESYMPDPDNKYDSQRNGDL